LELKAGMACEAGPGKIPVKVPRQQPAFKKSLVKEAQN